ncbi:hypothetical protein BC828DRAFT_389752 [Blastocladiella britannica]|nr:hypothetical protein BC828DRAFT_389752 [Blastocladiella britannica]
MNTPPFMAVPLSQLISQPWNPHHYDKSFARIWAMVTVVCMASAGLFNAALLLTLVSNDKIRRDNMQFSSNILFLVMCSGNAVYMTICALNTLTAWLNDHWDQPRCSLAASVHSFFLTFAMSISVFMTLERISVVMYSRRMPPRMVLVCVPIALILALSNGLLTFSNWPVIFATGLSCMSALPHWLGIFDEIILQSAICFLAVGNGLCYWKLSSMIKGTTVKSAIRTFAISTDQDRPHGISASTTGSLTTRENKLQHKFAVRGILAAFSLTVTVLPVSGLAAYFAFFDCNGPYWLEALGVLGVTFSDLIDPIIFLMFDPNLKNAMIQAFIPCRRRIKSVAKLDKVPSLLSFRTSVQKSSTLDVSIH